MTEPETSFRIALSEEELKSLRNLARKMPDKMLDKVNETVQRGGEDAEIDFYHGRATFWKVLSEKLNRPFQDS